MTTLALLFDKELSCGKEQKRKTSQPRCLFHMGGCQIIPPHVCLWAIRVILDSVTPSTLEETTEYVSVEGRCEHKGSVLNSLQSTVGKQRPPKVGQGCLWNWFLRYQKKQASPERQAGRAAVDGLNQEIVRETYFSVWLPWTAQ